MNFRIFLCALALSCIAPGVAAELPDFTEIVDSA